MVSRASLLLFFPAGAFNTTSRGPPAVLDALSVAAGATLGAENNTGMSRPKKGIVQLLRT
jgi:hypothetical protein